MTCTETNSADTLKAIWTAKGVPIERQGELLAQIAAKSTPGTCVGPFRIRGAADALAKAAGQALESRYPWGYRSSDSEP